MIQDTVKMYLLILLETISFLSNIVLFLGKLVSHYYQLSVVHDISHIAFFQFSIALTVIE